MDSSYLMLIYFNNQKKNVTKNDNNLSLKYKSCLSNKRKSWFSCFKKKVKFSI